MTRARDLAAFVSNADGDIKFDTDTLFIDSSANKVGIGTTTPSHLIDAQLSGTSSGEVISVGNVGTGVFGGIAVSNGGTFPVRHWGSSLEFYTGNSAYGSATERMRIDSDGDLNIVNTGQASLNYTTDGSTDYARITGGKSGSGVGDLRFFTYSGGIAERMRLHSGGDITLAKSTTALGDAGHTMGSDGYVYHTRSGDVMWLNRLGGDGTFTTFMKDSGTVGRIGSLSGIDVYIAGARGAGLRLTDAEFFPVNATGATNDNAIDLGHTVGRFDDIYATNSTIQTSDENEKQNIASLTSAEITAATAISKLFKTFKWKDKVAAKGDDARTHTGVVAQHIEKAMSDTGLDAGKYAFFISTTWWETQTEVPAVEADEENGIEAADAYTRTEEYFTKDEAPEGATEHNRKGIRYPELLAFIGAATEQRLTSIESRLTALEGE